ncbi:hypothetical protein FNV43_RR19353 [Rhamnella rubrinervis]|uniref:CG-1 domain-containing protein n=1 Tax=Rhamnella rubrinervis TaxID=2594499 RepID=A0A8K0EC70_9ROSA|nr:hypothetical protein FNV43_RR19353 [Rhamnella rubrinervis]
MAESRRYGLGNQLDIEQILIEAQHRWLRPAEICEILKNYERFRIAPEPANMPPSGSLFLFDRKVLRYFRKDGHSWRKKRDGKTVKEAHERLKAGSVDVLHCYYAHGEENENFQRRSYWMLEEDLSHINAQCIGIIFDILLESLGKTNCEIKREEKKKNCSMSKHSGSILIPNTCISPFSMSQVVSMVTSLRLAVKGDVMMSGNRTNFNRIRETEEAETAPNSEIDSSVSSSFPPNNYQVPSQTTDTTSLNSAQASEYEDAESDDYQEKLPAFPGVDFSSLPQTVKMKTVATIGATYEPQKHRHPIVGNFLGQETSGQLFADGFGKRQEFGSHPQVQEDRKVVLHAYPSGLQFRTCIKAQHSLLDSSHTEEGLKKLDSFNRWMSKELGDVNESHMQTSSGSYWDTVDAENGVDDSSQVRLDNYMLSPSLSGTSCIALLISLQTGRMKIQKSRLACSEVREFEYRINQIQDMDAKYDDSECTNEVLNLRFGKLLSLSSTAQNSDPNSIVEIPQLSSKISSSLKVDNDEWDQMLKLTSEKDFSLERVEEQLHQRLLKEKLHAWLLQKVAEGGKASVLDEDGQGVLHFAAALGYDWALEPTIVAGVSVNFRDVSGWTALHWAAYCGR